MCTCGKGADDITIFTRRGEKQRLRPQFRGVRGQDWASHIYAEPTSSLHLTTYYLAV